MKERWFENLNEVEVEAERQKMKRFILFTRPRAAGLSTTSRRRPRRRPSRQRRK